MKYIREKLKENPVGTASGIFVTVRGELPLPSWVVGLALLAYVYLAIDLLWWFGDHPEE